MTPLHIGDTVQLVDNDIAEGTVVELVNDGSTPQLVRIYWREPLNLLGLHRETEVTKTA